MEKFYTAAVKTVENEGELELFWKVFNVQDITMRAVILEKAMNCQLFDVPTTPVERYEVLKVMFLTFNWRMVDDIDTLKEIVNRL